MNQNIHRGVSVYYKRWAGTWNLPREKNSTSKNNPRFRHSTDSVTLDIPLKIRLLPVSLCVCTCRLKWYEILRTWLKVGCARNELSRHTRVFFELIFLRYDVVLKVQDYLDFVIELWKRVRLGQGGYLILKTGRLHVGYI